MHTVFQYTTKVKLLKNTDFPLFLNDRIKMANVHLHPIYDFIELCRVMMVVDEKLWDTYGSSAKYVI